MRTQAKAKPRRQSMALKRILAQEKPKIFVCSYCFTRFDRRDDFAEHLSAISGGEYTIDDWEQEEE